MSLQWPPTVTVNPRNDADDLMPAVYNELRRLAAAYLRRERPGQTLLVRPFVTSIPRESLAFTLATTRKTLAP